MTPANDPADTTEPRETSYVATFDPAGERASEAVVTAVSTLVGSRPVDLDPLYEVVEPDALDSLVEHAQRGDTGTHQLWFTYEGYDVGVRSDGLIRIRDDPISAIR